MEDKTVVITWYKGSTVIKDSSEFKITFDGTTTHLRIVKTKTTHSSTYRVVAKNEFGEDETSAVLTVKQEDEEVSTKFLLHIIYMWYSMVQFIKKDKEETEEESEAESVESSSEESISIQVH